MADVSADGEWLTYADAAIRLGIKIDSVKRRAAARKWPRRQGNDGRARVRIPSDAIPDATPAPSPAPTPEVAPDDGGIVARLAVAEARLSDALAERDRWREMAEALRRDLAAERSGASRPTIGFFGRLFGR